MPFVGRPLKLNGNTDNVARINFKIVGLSTEKIETLKD